MAGFRNIVWASAALITCTPHIALAQNAATSVVEADEIVVTARKIEEDVQDVPLSITVLDAETMALRGVSAPADVYRVAPNVEYNPSGIISNALLTIRGVRSSDVFSGFETANGVILDEVFVGRSAAFNAALLDIDRIEVLRGPQGTLQGKNIIGGALNIVTRRPSQTFDGALSIEGGSDGLFNVAGFVSGPLTDTLAGKLSLSRRVRDGFTENLFTGDTLGEDDNVSGRAQLLWSPSERFEALLTVDSSRDDVNDNSADYTAPGETTTPFTATGLDRQVEGDANGTGQRDTFGAALRANYELSPSLDFTSLTSYRTFEIAQFIEQDGLSVPLVNNGTDIDQTQFSQELRLTYGANGFGWIAGAYYMRETIEDQTRSMINVPLIAGVLFPPFVVPLDSLSRSETTSTSYAAFASFTTELSDAWTLSAGARVTRDERDIVSSAFSLINGGTGFSDAPAIGEQFAPLAGLTAVPLAVGAPTSSAEETALTGDVSLTYDWSDDVSTYLRYARGYKAGGFQTGLPTLPTALGDVVDPEFVDSYEIGFRSTALDRNLIFNATAFYSLWQDRQSFRVEIIGGVPTYILFNDPESVIYGLEAELQYRPTEELTFGANLGVQETEFTESDDPALEGREFSRVSPVTIGLTADWVHPISSDWSFRLGGDARWAQSYFFDDANTPGFKQPDYWLVNALAGFETNDGAISLRLWGRNLTDEDVVVSAVSGVPSEATAPFTPGGSRIVVNLREPRTWGVQAAFRF